MPTRRLQVPDGDVVLFPDLFAEAEARKLFRALQDGLIWRQENVFLFGREFPQPRLIAWHGDPGCSYTYSGLTLDPEPWTSELRVIRDRAGGRCGAHFNCVLVNLYRDGNDSVGWHCDDEPAMGPEPTIASVSLGAPRAFQLRHKTRRELPTVEVELANGSLLVMAGATQDRWRHCVPKRRGVHEPRINLSFRRITAKCSGG